MKREGVCMFTVLVVDDEDGFVQITQIILKKAGFKTLAASNGAEALDLIYTYRPDVVILDDMMPGMTGGDVCSQIKRDAEVSHTRVIMHSAGAKIRNPAYIAQIGADGVLFKPSLPGEIIEAVNSVIGARA
jgi:two-component system, OmpR family, alkaline phosphatase synthesis response regulator PhoP